MSKIINYTRLTTSDRLSDRFLTCQIYRPVDPEQAQDGMIFSQIEIGNPWFPTAQIGQTVINTLIREYYRGSNSSDLVNFENAIKKVNEALAQIAQNGETDWIGKFNGVLALVVDTEVHFAQTGLCEAYLYRGNKVNQITEGLNNDQPPHPLKTFSNLTSGTIQAGDKIVIGNSSFFDVISAPELEMLVASFRPALTAVECAKILKGRNVQAANAIFIELTTKEELANVPPDQKVDAIYIDQPMYSLGTSLRSFWTGIISPAGKKIGHGLASGSKKTADFLSPRLKKGLEKTKKHTGRAAHAIMSAGKNAEEKVSDESREKNPSSVLSKKFFLKIKNRSRRTLIRFGLYSSKKSKMILAILIAIVLLLGLTVTYSLVKRSKTKNTASLQATLDQINSIQTAATLANSKQDEKSAVSDYQQIINLASTLKGTKFDTQAAQSSKNAKDKIAEITKLQSLAPVAQIALKTDGSSLALLPNTIYLFSKTGDILAKKSADKDFASVATSGQKIVISAVSLDDGKVACVTNDKTIGLFDPNKKAFELQSVPLTYADIIKSFASTLYVLDQPANQIYKINSEDGAYNKSSEYLKDGSIISDSADMAIDGSIYLLSPDGKISKFSRGNKISDITFTLPASEKLSGYKRIFTSDLANNIMLFSDTAGQARLIEIDKSGKFIGQYNLEKADGAQDVAIDLSAREVYILKGTQVISYKY